MMIIRGSVFALSKTSVSDLRNSVSSPRRLAVSLIFTVNRRSSTTARTFLFCFGILNLRNTPEYKQFPSERTGELREETRVYHAQSGGRSSNLPHPTCYVDLHGRRESIPRPAPI